MTTESPETYVTPEVKANIGKECEPFTWPEPLDRSALRRFVQASHDENPLYSDQAAAEKSRYGALITPPFYLARGPFGFPQADPEHNQVAAAPQVEIPGMSRRVNGGNETEYFLPVYLGDTLTSRTRVADIYQRQGRSGPLVVVVNETAYTNQRGELATISRQMRIHMP